MLAKRVMLKLSGEGLMGKKDFGMDVEVIDDLARQIKMVHEKNIDICIVVGGGNIFRGAKGAADGMNRTVADHIGMLATVMNALTIQHALEKQGLEARVSSGLNIPDVCEKYAYRKAQSHMNKKRVVIFAAGTGNPFFTTDTAATLRASEMQCDLIMKATQVDGVYDKDPKTNSDAIRYENVSFDEVISKDLRVMDAAAIALARENNIPILVFSQHNENALFEAVMGRGKYTKISNEV